MKAKWLLAVGATVALTAWGQVSEAQESGDREANLLAEARRHAAQSVQETEDCLNGIDGDRFNQVDGCGEDWPFQNRVAFYLKLLNDQPQSLYD